MATVTVKDQELTLAPLKSLQVADLMDDLERNPAEGTANAIAIRRNLRIVSQSLANSGNALGDSEETAMAALNDGVKFQDLNAAFIEVLKITGLSKKTEGEAPAAESISSASSAAS